jgi:hypothetical protein
MVHFPRHSDGPHAIEPPGRIGAAEFPRLYPFPHTNNAATSEQLTKRLTGQWPGQPENVPGIDVDAAQPDGIVDPERQLTTSRKYEVYVAMAGVGGNYLRHLGGTLAAGATWLVECTFVPEFWRVSIHGAATDYALVDVDGTGQGAMPLLNPNASLTFPARGLRLAVAAPSANTGPLVVSVEAFAGVKTEGE